MVKFSPALLVFTTLALSVFASPIEHRDIPGVEAALRQIGTDITNLDGLVNGLKAPLPMHDALALKTWVDKTSNDINKATVDVKGVGNVSDSDAGAIFAEVNGFMDNILKVLMDIGRQKAVLLSSGIPGANVIIRNDLVAMHKESTELSDALINAAPADLKNKAMQLKNAVEMQFVKLLTDFN